MKLRCRWVDWIIYFFVLLTNLPQNLSLLFFITWIYYAFLALKNFKSLIQAEKLLWWLFMKSLCFGDRARLSFIDMSFELLDVFSGLILVLLYFSNLLLFKSLDITGGVLIDLFDVVLKKNLFIFFNDILFDIIMPIQSDGSISQTWPTSHIKVNNKINTKLN